MMHQCIHRDELPVLLVLARGEQHLRHALRGSAPACVGLFLPWQWALGVLFWRWVRVAVGS